MGGTSSDEARAVLDEVGRQVELGRAGGKTSLHFVRYISENDLAPAQQGFVDHFPRLKALDLYRDDPSGACDPEYDLFLLSHIDRCLTKLDGLLTDYLAAGNRGDWVLLVTPDDVKAMVDNDSGLWKRRSGFHSWPRTRTWQTPGGSTQAGGGAGGGATGEPLTADVMKAVVRQLEHDPENLDDLTKQRAFTMVMNMLRQRQFEESRRVLMRLIHALKIKGDAQGLATAYVLVGNITFEMNNYRNAIEWYDEAQAYIEKLDDDVKLSDLYHQRGYVRFLLGEYKASLDDFRRALTVDEALNDDFRKSLIYRRIGISLDLLGSNDEAENFFRQALGLEQRLQNEAGVARVYQHLGRLAEKRGNFADAADAYERSLEIKKRMNDERGLASLYHQYGNLRFNQEEYRDALELYRKSLALEERQSDYQSIARTLLQIGMTQEALQQFKEATTTLRKASTLLGKLNSPLVEKVNNLIREVESRQGDDLAGVFGSREDE
jgi:tetratricopeptide (TPR) repeat protein